MRYDTTERLIRSIFSGEAAIVVTGDHKTFLLEWKEKLSKLLPRNFRMEYDESKESKPEKQLSLSYEHPHFERSYYDTIKFVFTINSSNYLCFYRRSYQPEKYPVTDISQVLKIITELDKRHDKMYSNRLKKAKVINLKKSSVISTIKLLAKELNFEYSLSTNFEQKIKLFVKLDDSSQLEIDIPYSRFQEVLSGLRNLIESVTSIYEQGLKFKVKHSSSDHWTKPE